MQIQVITECIVLIALILLVLDAGGALYSDEDGEIEYFERKCEYGLCDGLGMYEVGEFDDVSDVMCPCKDTSDMDDDS